MQYLGSPTLFESPTHDQIVSGGPQQRYRSSFANKEKGTTQLSSTIAATSYYVLHFLLDRYLRQRLCNEYLLILPTFEQYYYESRRFEQIYHGLRWSFQTSRSCGSDQENDIQIFFFRGGTHKQQTHHHEQHRRPTAHHRSKQQQSKSEIVDRQWPTSSIRQHQTAQA